MITRVVLSAAGPNGLIQLGMLAQAIETDIISIVDITHIYASSAGSIIGVLLCLRIPIQEIIDYFIHRPWDKWFKIDMLHCIENKGLVCSDCFSELLVPFFNAYDVPMHITMQELYNRTGVEFHVFTTAISHMKSIDLNYTTYPDLSIIQAISMSSSIPMLFTPIQYENDYYMDGGILNHCPATDDPDSTLIISINHLSTLDLDSSFQFLQHILLKSFDIISCNTTPPNGKYVFCFNTKDIAIHPLLWEKTLSNKEYRSELIHIGKQHIHALTNLVGLPSE